MSLQIETIVLSLQVDRERRDHISEHFLERGITDFRFHDALTPEAQRVKSFYIDGKVAAYPPCFRCGLATTCQCKNNILIPQQVANFLSFHDIWSSVSGDAEKKFLICEDDVFFYPNAMPLLEKFLEDYEAFKEPLLIRLSASGNPIDCVLDVPLLNSSSNVQMSNPAYIINCAMAKLLVQTFDAIKLTSDTWLHQEVASMPGVHSVTTDPIIATDLSFNTQHAKFRSRIHPKGIDDEDARRKREHVMRAESRKEYERLRDIWEAGAPRAKQWNYLASPPFQMRYILAAGILKHYENVLEIGSYRTPIFKFLEDEGRTVRCIDPMIFESRSSIKQGNETLDYRSLELVPFAGKPFALVLIGLDLPVTYKIIHYLKAAEVAVIEFPEDAEWKRSRETFDRLVGEAELNIISRVHLDFDGNDFSAYSGPGDWPARTKRNIYVVSHKLKGLEDLGDRSPFVEPLQQIDTADSKLINVPFVAENIMPEAAFEFSHGGFGPANYLGGGLLYYCLPYMMRSQVCVCLGSGGAFVPRLIRQAQRDIGLARIGRTILVDGNRGPYGRPNWLDDQSVFRKAYPDIEIVVADTVETAGDFSRQGLTIDYLHIDADHSFEGSLLDFESYLPLMRKGGVVTFHDTRPNAHESTTCWKTIVELRSRGYELVDFPTLANGVAIIRV